MIKRIIVRIIPAIILSITFSAISDAGTYYVSPTGAATWANCSGATPLNGASACSWQTAMANAVAGDTVYFRGGIYDPNVGGTSSIPAMNPAHSGVSEQPITFIAYPNETPIIHEATGTTPSGTRPTIGTYQRSYIIWDGFTLDRNLDNGLGESAMVRFEQSSHIIIKNCDMIGRPHKDQYNGSLIHFVGGNSYIDVYNNKLHGVSADPNSIAPVINATAIWVFNASHVNIYNNDIYDNNIGVAWKVNPNYVNVYLNHFFNCERSAIKVHPETSGDTDFLIYQNVVRNCTAFVSATDAVATPYYNLKVYNNTIYNVAAGSGVVIGWPNYNNARNAEVYNNIFSFGGTNSLFLNYYSGASFPIYADFNDFYGIGHWDLNYQNSYNSLSAWRTASGVDLNSITSNPLFLNTGGSSPEDYMLASGSPAKGTGRNGTDMGAFLNGYATRIGYRSPSRPSPPQNLQ